MPKIALFFLKSRKHHRALLPPDSHLPPATGGSAPRPPDVPILMTKSWLRAWLRVWLYAYTQAK